MTSIASGSNIDSRASRTDALTLSENARKVLEARYLKKNEAGECTESPEQLFRRVASTIADVELSYGGTEVERRQWEDRFYRLMTSGAFMPNSPTLMNAGREMGMLSACFVLPVRDSVNDIFNSIKHTALIQKAGGGTGFAFDELRPTGDYISSSGGTTSGPITFWRAFSEATNAIQQGAFRRGANMGMMYIHHPDILKFLHAKQDLSQFTNYNISVKMTDAWMEEFLADPDSPHVVRNPRNGKAFLLPRDLDIWKYDVRGLIEIETVEPVPASGMEKYFTSPRLLAPIPRELDGKVYTKRDIWRIIINNAWQTGEPGVVFMDRINEHNPTPHVGRIEATNPCGEQPLLPYEACNLGSVNLGLFVIDGCTPAAHVDWEALKVAVHISTRYLDNVIDANNYPLPEIDRVCKDNRKIGLGIMGFADALYKLNVPYNSEDGVAWGERFMKFINDEAHHYSEHLARVRGCFPNWKGSIWQTRRNRMMRNAAVTTVAPTGTISIIANCSGGIEPMFSLAFIRNVLRGQKQGEKPLVEVNDTFRDVARARGFLSDALLERIAAEGTLHHVDAVPDDVKRVFVCAHDITPEWHMKMQAGFQRHCDSSISKTINFPNAASVEDVEQIYRMAFALRCKGVTVYRDGCRSFQPMALKNEKPAAESHATEAKPAQAPTAEANVAEIHVADATAARTAPAEAPTISGGAEFAPPDRAVPSEFESDTADSKSTSSSRVAQSAPIRPLEPQDLPEIVSGLRIRQMTPFGNMHVKITVDPRAGRELEVFAQLGKGGDVANSDLEGICRVSSLWLRAGGALTALIKQLEGIGSSLQIPTRAGRIMSLPDGLACALKKYMQAKQRFGLRALLLGEIDLSDLNNPNPAPHSPETMPADRVSRGGGPSNGDNGPSAQSGIAAGSSRLTADAADLSRVLPQNEERRSSSASRPRAAAETANATFGGDLTGGEPATAVLDAPETTFADALVVETTESDLDAPAHTNGHGAMGNGVASANGNGHAQTASHVHDSAAHYKVHCPQCDATLAMQEGCRKCYACGWAAC
ncbi:MAG: adenosylcobalamin-dependent ribonucleoside-diphosphate reductase [Phycisphaerae bacterium]